MLSACGGSSSGPDSFAATPVALDLQPRAINTFRFSWAEVPEAAEYRLLEDAYGHSGYQVIATLPADRTDYDLDVFLPGRVNARYMLQACNAAGVCVNSAAAHVAGTLAEAAGYVKASNTGAGDSFGHAVAMSGDGRTLAVSARNEASAATGIGGDGTTTAPATAARSVFTDPEHMPQGIAPNPTPRVPTRRRAR